MFETSNINPNLNGYNHMIEAISKLQAEIVNLKEALRVPKPHVNSIVCYRCHKIGHIAKQCYTVLPRREDINPRVRNTQQRYFQEGRNPNFKRGVGKSHPQTPF